MPNLKEYPKGFSPLSKPSKPTKPAEPKKNFYYSSHWNQPGGGLPIAIKTGRDVAKEICKEYKVKFKTIPQTK